MKNLFQLAGAALLAATMLFSTTSCNQDPCVAKKITCANGGTCLDGLCSCVDGYEGELCAAESRTKFLGANNAQAVYTGPETCTVGTDNYSVTVSASTTDAIKLVVTNLYNNTPPYVFPIAVKGSKFTGSSISVGTTAIIKNITGTLDANKLTIVYTIGSTLAGIPDNTCTFEGTKQ